MKLVFATIYDPRDIRRGSGTYYFMSQEIERQGHIVHFVGAVEEKPLPFISRLICSIHYRTGKRHKTFLDPFVGMSRGKDLTRRLKKFDYDILLTNDYALAAYTSTTRPIIIYTDAMIPLDYPQGVPETSRIADLSRWGVKLYQHTIRKALERVSLAIFPTQALLEDALKYCRDLQKVALIPFGANMIDPGPDIAWARKFAQIKQKQRFDLLFVGKDWERKGGAIAVSTVRILQKRGIKAHLHVVGVTLPEAEMGAVSAYGLLDKSVEADSKRLESLFHMCDAFILPSLSEGFGIVFAEAAAYGLPALAYNIDGVNIAVCNGKSGVLIEPGQPAYVFADTIEGWFENESTYDKLVLMTRHHYEQAVNWPCSISTMFYKIDQILAGQVS